MDSDNWVGKTIGKYRLESFVGCGGMGTLYKACHETLEKTVALKVLHPNLVIGDQGEKIAARFIREARTAAQLKHPNIVEVYDIEKHDEMLYIVMEFILGRSIQQILQSKGTIPLLESLYIVREVAKGLSLAHEKGIIHRDIKPANIMITREGVVKLTDFGLARVANDVSVSVVGQVFGTPLYSAPEQVEDGTRVDSRADLYSLGVSLFQMIAGETPYTGKNSFVLMSQHLSAEIPSLRSRVPSVPPAIDQMVAKLMSKKPEERYESAAILVKEIDRYSGVISNKKLDAQNALENSPFLREVLEKDSTDEIAIADETPVDAGSRELDRQSLLSQKILDEKRREDEQKKNIKVLIVDDSSLMRKVIQKGLEGYEGIEVVGSAKNGEEALKIIPELAPDVITLDVNMPVMDGLTTLKHIAIQFPRPVVMLSAFTQEGAHTTFDCLTLGAIDFICKPDKSEGRIEDQLEILVQKIRQAARVKVKSANRMRIKKALSEDTKKLIARHNASWIVVLGSGDGADGTCLRILPYIPKSFPAAILSLHYMDPKIFPTFCGYLNSYSRIVVKELEDKEILKKGVCYLVNAPALFSLKSSMLGACCNLIHTNKMTKTELVDTALKAVSEKFGAKTIGVLLTGKQSDGVDGLAAVKAAGGKTLVQHPNTCVNSENICSAIQRQCVDRVVAEADIPAMLWHLLKDGMGPKA